MKEKVGEVFSIAKDNQPVPGCTILYTEISSPSRVILLGFFDD